MGVPVGVSLAEQFTLNYCNLRINHVAEVQLSTASKSKMLRRVRQHFRMRSILECRHQNEQRRRFDFQLITSPTEALLIVVVVVS